MRILIIDDDKDFLASIAEAVRSEGYEVVTSENGREGLKFAGLHAFCLIITDIFMPEMDGNALIMALRQRLPGIPVIAISGGGQFGDMKPLEKSPALGATYTLSKPFRIQRLIDLISKALSASTS